MILFAFCFLGTVYAQEESIDSLILQARKQSINEAELVQQLSNWQKAFNLTKDLKTDYRLIEICTALGDLFYENKIYDSAITYYQFALPESPDTLHHTEPLANLYIKIGKAYSQQYKPDSAMLYYQHILNDFEKPNRIELYQDIVDMYSQSRDYEKVLSTI